MSNTMIAPVIFTPESDEETLETVALELYNEDDEVADAINRHFLGKLSNTGLADELAYYNQRAYFRAAVQLEEKAS